MTALARARHIVDAALPQAAAWYRKRRDDHTSRYDSPSETPWGFALYGDEGLAESRQQSHEATLFGQLLTNADHVVDVGANVGLFTLLAWHHGVPVTAVEPSPMNLAQLYRNLRLNSADGVEVLPVALSDQVGIADLYGGGQGASLRKGWGGMASTYTTPVPVHTLDGLLADRLSGQRVVIKIDAEGAELPILLGAGRLIAADPAPSWIVEVGLTENFDGDVNPDFVAIFQTFWDAGYSATCVEESGRTVTSADVHEWVARQDRGFWNINYVFERTRHQ